MDPCTSPPRPESDVARLEAALHQALRETFPCSDPIVVGCLVERSDSPIRGPEPELHPPSPGGKESARVKAEAAFGSQWAFWALSFLRLSSRPSSMGSTSFSLGSAHVW